MKANTPMRDGFVYFDFILQKISDDFVAGPPYISQFLYAVFRAILTLCI